MEDDQSIMDDSWKMTEDGEESEWYIEMKTKPNTPLSLIHI